MKRTIDNALNKRWISISVLQVLVFVYSLSQVLSKYAAGEGNLNLAFILLYGASLGLLGVYALGWQQVIKKLPISVAYANRAAAVVWGIAWGCVLFGDGINAGKIVGAMLVITGIVIIGSNKASFERHSNEL